MKIVARCFNCDKLIWLPTSTHFIELTGTIGKNNTTFRKEYPFCRKCQQRKVLGDTPI